MFIVIAVAIVETGLAHAARHFIRSGGIRLPGPNSNERALAKSYSRGERPIDTNSRLPT